MNNVEVEIDSYGRKSGREIVSFTKSTLFLQTCVRLKNNTFSANKCGSGCDNLAGCLLKVGKSELCLANSLYDFSPCGVSWKYTIQILGVFHCETALGCAKGLHQCNGERLLRHTSQWILVHYAKGRSAKYYETPEFKQTNSINYILNVFVPGLTTVVEGLSLCSSLNVTIIPMRRQLIGIGISLTIRSCSVTLIFLAQG